MNCPVCCRDDCAEWNNWRKGSWHTPPTGWKPLKPVAPGELQPCGSNASGSILEFFANPADIPDLLENGIRVREHGTLRRFDCELTSTPYYGNGDVQIRAHLKDAA